MVDPRKPESAYSYWERTRDKGDKKNEPLHSAWVKVAGEWVPTMQCRKDDISITRAFIDRVDAKSTIAVLLAVASFLLSIVPYVIG